MKWFLSVVGFFVCASFLSCDSEKEASQARSSTNSSVYYSTEFLEGAWIDSSDFAKVQDDEIMDELYITRIRRNGELTRNRFSINFFESKSSCVVNSRLECVIVSDDVLREFVKFHTTPDDFHEMLESIDRVYIKFSKINDSRFRTDYIMVELKNGDSEKDPEFDSQTFIKIKEQKVKTILRYIDEDFMEKSGRQNTEALEFYRFLEGER